MVVFVLVVGHGGGACFVYLSNLFTLCVLQSSAPSSSAASSFDLSRFIFISSLFGRLFASSCPFASPTPRPSHALCWIFHSSRCSVCFHLFSSGQCLFYFLIIASVVLLFIFCFLVCVCVCLSFFQLFLFNIRSDPLQTVCPADISVAGLLPPSFHLPHCPLTNTHLKMYSIFGKIFCFLSFCVCF